MRLDIAKKAFEDVGFILFDRFIAKYNEFLAKEDPDAWREEYRKKQAAGVMFEKFTWSDRWIGAEENGGDFIFRGNKEDYREVQEAPKRTIPHLAERKLWLAQREAGTNEVWQCSGPKTALFDVYGEPAWHPDFTYRVKPKTVKHYFALLRYESCKAIEARVFKSVEHANSYANHHVCTIIGNIEEREVPVS